MNKLLYAIVCLSVLVACKQQPGYRIEGSVPGTPDGMKAYLLDWDTPVDSAVVKGGKFVMTGKVDVPVCYQLYIDLSPDKIESFDKDMRGTDIFMENSTIRYESPSIDSLPSRLSFQRNIEGKVIVSGSASNDLYVSFQEKIKPYQNQKEKAWNEYLNVYHIPAGEKGIFNTREGLALVREIQKAQNEINQLQTDFIKTHSNSPVAINVAQNLAYTGTLTRAEMKELLNTIDPSLHQTPAYEKLKESMEQFYPTAIGEKYIDLNLVDENGKNVKLSDYVKPGQYNMLEFWASWCGPCRYEIPHLHHVYEAYGKGKDALNMISISIDERDKDWKKALKDEKMKWAQLCDIKGFKGDVAAKYKVNGVPFCLILDKEGRIIAREVRGSELDMVLIEHMGDRYKE